jgi:DMSO/TMAO reductase YedYZ heme-binding membrane subunit
VSSTVLWDAARAGGIVAWSLAAASVVWGLLLSTRILGRAPRPAWLLDLHRFLGGAALIFTGIHVLAIVADDYVDIGPINALVPFTGTWHPAAVAWGIVALYLLLAVELTSLARRRLPYAAWRRIHLASFGLFAASTVHAFTAGTDATVPVFVAGVVITVAAVAALVAVRLNDAERTPTRSAAGR